MASWVSYNCGRHRRKFKGKRVPMRVLRRCVPCQAHNRKVDAFVKPLLESGVFGHIEGFQIVEKKVR